MRRTFTQTTCLFWVTLLFLAFSGGSVNAQSASLPYLENFDNGEANFNLLKLPDLATTGTKTFGIATTNLQGGGKIGELEIQADPGKASNVSYSGLFSLNKTITFRKGYYYTLTVKAKAGANLGGGASGSTTTSGRLRFVKGTTTAELSTATGSYLISDQTVSGTNYTTFTAYLKSSDLAADANLLVGLRLDGFTTSADANKATLTLDDFTVTENTCPTISAPVPTTTSVTRCGTGSVTMSVAAPSNTQLENRWYLGSTLVFTGNSYTVTLSDNNLKTYTVEAHNTLTGCVSASRATITAKANVVPNAPTIPAAATHTRCGSGTVTLQVTGAPAGGSYRWYNVQTGGTAISGATSSSYTTPSLTVTTSAVTTTYFVSAVSAEGCESSTRTQVTATANPLPTASVTVNGSASYCPATTASKTYLSVATSTGYTYQWYKDGSVISGAINFNYTPTVSGNYYVVVTNTSSCTAQSTSYNIDVQTELTSGGTIGLLGGASYVEPGKPASYVVTSDMQTRDHAQSYRWYMISDAGTTVLSSTSSQLDIASVPDYKFTLRCEITPKSGLCYNPTPLRIETTEITPLPVEIIYFNAAKQGNNVLLEWATASEKDNTGFEVQVSQDGFNFRNLGFVPTKNGNTVLKQVYTYKDVENGKYGTRYYRLKQIDEDGKFEYFTTKAVSFGQVSSNSLKAFPNPFDSEVSLEINADQAGKLNVQVLDAMGRSVLVEQFAISKGSSNEKIVIGQSLPKGIYFVRTEMNGIANNFKLLKK